MREKDPLYGHIMPGTPLPAADAAVLRTLLASEGRVMSRTTIARDSGLGHLSTRRTDAVIASLRKRLGDDCLVTVRQRGWILSEDGAKRAREVLAASL